MSQITVVVQAPFPLPIPGGRHLYNGEVTEIENDQFVQDCIAAGLLAPVALPAPETPAKATAKIQTSTSQETN